MSIHHFLELTFAFKDHKIGVPFPITSQDLANIWYCTPRNVKVIIRKLTQLGWIEWQAGRGRGNLSLLTIATSSDELLLEEAKTQTSKGQIKHAFELIDKYSHVPSTKELYMEWLSSGMGVSREIISDQVMDRLRFPVCLPIHHLDPARLLYVFDEHIAQHLFDTLVEHHPEDNKILPSIAHAWESDSTFQTWTFHLRKGIMFHHGRELSAEDVIFTLNRLRHDPERYEQSWMSVGIQSVIAIDRKTVRINLKESNYLFLHFMSSTEASIVPQDVVEQDEEAFIRKPIGTGPFRLVQLDEQICVLEAFPTHFKGRPNLDRVEILLLPEHENFSLRKLDWTPLMTTNSSVVQVSQGPGISPPSEWNELEVHMSGCSILLFNQQKNGPQNHIAFREAMALICKYPGCSYV
ncbi:ABC transporter substrate-binding protein [Paenibacillus sp. N3/727]|uniref:ABC transporter substrate-binding protein n=1 Tax=Paenibacillus sp. N3/727 TaxID=2925845 RepID=UPI001F53D9E3|nr:ABC transporter substrate-binding protein [Paenibacillus sp. N3/727]UNK20947.1 ABC transporter substrate-binding protein [Paenibacillus sp. N3/727]